MDPLETLAGLFGGRTVNLAGCTFIKTEQGGKVVEIGDKGMDLHVGGNYKNSVIRQAYNDHTTTLNESPDAERMSVRTKVKLPALTSSTYAGQGVGSISLTVYDDMEDEDIYDVGNDYTKRDLKRKRDNGGDDDKPADEGYDSDEDEVIMGPVINADNGQLVVSGSGPALPKNHARKVARAVHTYTAMELAKMRNGKTKPNRVFLIQSGHTLTFDHGEREEVYIDHANIVNMHVQDVENDRSRRTFDTGGDDLEEAGDVDAAGGGSKGKGVSKGHCDSGSDVEEGDEEYDEE